MKHFIKALVLFTFLFFSNVSWGQMEKFKALFMYNFTKNIEWPANYRQGDFIISVLGSSKVIQELETIAKTQKAGNQNIVIHPISNLNEAGMCHILFIAGNKSDQLSEALSKMAGKSSLIITEKKGSVESGSCINYLLDGEKIKFEISKKNIEKRGLKVSGTLLNLGISVN
jgi:hypothetical protein